MIKNFKYFVYGTPAKQTDPLYALYQPVLDRFLIVADQLECIQKLSALLLTRYATHVCCVTPAVNFVPNIIDNEVCDCWSFSNKSDIKIEHFLYNHDPIQIKELIPVENTNLWNVIQEKEWLLFCLSYLSFFKTLKVCYFHYYQIDSILQNILPKDQLKYYPHELERQVMNILFFGNDMAKSELDISKLIHKDNRVRKMWEKYFNKQ